MLNIVELYRHVQVTPNRIGFRVARVFWAGAIHGNAYNSWGWAAWLLIHAECRSLTCTGTAPTMLTNLQERYTAHAST